MSLLTCRSPQQVAPDDVTGITLTPPGTSWTNSPWVTVQASTPTAQVLLALVVKLGFQIDFEIDIGVGAEDAEVVIATTKGYGNSITASANGGRMEFGIPIDAIPAESRVVARIRHNHSSTAPSVIWMQYLEKPIVGTIETTTAPQKVLPSAALITLASGSGAWVSGSYVQIINPLVTDILVVGFTLGVGFTDQVEIDLATGAAGFEVVKTTWRLYHQSNNGYPFCQKQAHALTTFPAGARLAARMRSKEGVPAFTMTCGLLYYEASA